MKKLSMLLVLLLSYSANANKPTNNPDSVAKGKASYSINCVICHGEKGDGNGSAGKYMNPKPRNFSTDNFKNGDSEQQIFETITKGLDGTSMPSFSSTPENERWELAYYIRTFRNK